MTILIGLYVVAVISAFVAGVMLDQNAKDWRPWVLVAFVILVSLFLYPAQLAKLLS